MSVKQNKDVLPLTQNPPQAKTFCRHLGRGLVGLEPLYHRLTVFLNREKAVSSENKVFSQLSFKCLVAHSTRFALWPAVSIGVPIGRALLYPSSFSLLPTVECDTDSPSLDNFIAKVRKVMELSLRTYRPRTRDFAGPIFFGRPLPPACVTSPVFLIFRILYLIVVRGMFVILCSSLGEHTPWFQKWSIVCRCAVSLFPDILRENFSRSNGLNIYLM